MFNGLFDGTNFVSGKSEVKLSGNVIKNFEGDFNTPFVAPPIG